MCSGQPELHSMILIPKKEIRKEKKSSLKSGAQRDRSWVCGVSGGFTRLETQRVQRLQNVCVGPKLPDPAQHGSCLCHLGKVASFSFDRMAASRVFALRFIVTTVRWQLGSQSATATPQWPVLDYVSFWGLRFFFLPHQKEKSNSFDSEIWFSQGFDILIFFSLTF